MKIAITGKQCAGKTTLMKLFIDKYGGVQVKFIDKLYQINELLNVPKNRGFMQDLGEAIRKYFGKDYFVKDFIKRAENSKQNLFCDDIRKIIEFEVAKNCGFYTIFIEANEDIRKDRAKKLGLDFIEEHPAESEISILKSMCDTVITNNGEITDLEDFVKNFKY
jgi:dephospho-CoA kinase